MLRLLRDKKVIFFDVGYTLDMPASGDWMFTNRFLQEAGDRLKACSDQSISRAKETGLRFLAQNHLITTVEAEINHISRYFSFQTFSCFLGVFKPDSRMYLDALGKSGVPPDEAVFIDDSVHNPEGAAALGIQPILTVANPEADVETSFLKIKDLRELIRIQEGQS